MKNVLIASVLALTVMGAAPMAFAETNPVEERLVQSLTDQGWVIIEEGYTFLGRLRIVAENGELHREIVVNPGTGEVLRDYAELITDDVPNSTVAAATGTGSHHSHGSTATAGVAATSGNPVADEPPTDMLLLAPALSN